MIKNLGNLAAHGCNVLCTIHQPSSEVFHLFSRVLVLHEGATLASAPPPSCRRARRAATPAPPTTTPPTL